MNIIKRLFLIFILAFCLFVFGQKDSFASVISQNNLSFVSCKLDISNHNLTENKFFIQSGTQSSSQINSRRKSKIQSGTFGDILLNRDKKALDLISDNNTSSHAIKSDFTLDFLQHQIQPMAP